MVQARVLDDSGTTVALSFAIRSEIFDIIGKTTKPPAKPGH
jgi:hypothetical protein